jgi:hypothetical protein
MNRAVAVWIGLVTVLAGCGVMPLPGQRPVDAVRGAVDRIVAHDLPGAARFTCLAQRGPNDFPFIIQGIFSPVGAVPTPSIPETLALITIDTRDLRITDAPGDVSDDLEADVQLSGSLWLTLDPTEVEAAVRSAVALQNDRLDEGQLAQTIAGISHGPVQLPIDQPVHVVREEGDWRV